LDIKYIQRFDEALIWKWRAMHENKGMWKEIIKSKYGNGREVSKMSKIPYE